MHMYVLHFGITRSSKSNNHDKNLSRRDFFPESPKEDEDEVEEEDVCVTGVGPVALTPTPTLLSSSSNSCFCMKERMNSRAALSEWMFECDL